VCPSTMGGSGLLVKSARSPGNQIVRGAAAGLGKLCNVCWHRCMGVTAWRESVAEWVGPIRHTERARIGATVQSCLCSWRGQLECNTGHVACTVCHVDNDKFVSSLQQRCVCGHLAEDLFRTQSYISGAGVEDMDPCVVSHRSHVARLDAVQQLRATDYIPSSHNIILMLTVCTL
jgi:hypothetical protein